MGSFRLRLAFSLLAVSSCNGGGSDGSGTGDTETTTGTMGGPACYEDREAMKAPPGDSVMDAWGSACSTDEECKQRLGDDAAVCDFTAVVYELPGGFCTKPCVVGDDPNNTQMTYELDDPECDPNGGVACVGANGIYARCAVPCTDDSNCPREGYFCRTMPQIAGEQDPTFCLMDDCCESSCAVR